jgi:hypothetical protein
MPAKEPLLLSRPIALVTLFAFFQLCVAFLTDSQTFTHEESMWHYIGRNWFRHGLTPYAGGIDNKSPLIFAVFGFSDTLFGINFWFPRITGIIAQSAGMIYLYKIALIIANRYGTAITEGRSASPVIKEIQSRQTAIIALTLYGLSVLWRVTGGKYVSFTETYAVTCTLASVYYYIAGEARVKLFASGALAALAIGWRLSASFSVLAIFIHATAQRRHALIPFAAGAISGLAALLLVAIAAGINLQDLYFFAFADNLGAGSTTDHSFAWRTEKFIDNFFYSELIFFYPALIAYFFTKKQYSLLTIWLVCEFISINALGIYARPHFKQLLPVLCLVSGVSIAHLVHQYGVSFRNVMIVAWLVFFPKITEPISGLKKLINPPADRSKEYCTAPFARTDEISEKKLGLWIRANTKPGELVFVAGFGARVQLYSERLSPTVYFNVTQTPRAITDLIVSINQTKPQIIAVPLFADYKKYVRPAITQPIEALISTGYSYERCLYGYGIYRLNNSSPNPIGEFTP